MATRVERDRARRKGVRAAQRAHAQLGTDLSLPVDIMTILARECWLVFAPLDSLYGQYQPNDGQPAVMLNQSHPLPLQRFTAGHEYGHHKLGHRPPLDDRERVDPTRQSDDLDEIAAQAFAGEFLMPLDLINHALQDLTGPDERRPHLGPATVYALSLRFGTTYRATATQLLATKQLTGREYRHLIKTKPRDIKATLGGMPADSWADVWSVDETQDGTTVRGRPGDEIRIAVSEEPSTGYLWDADIGRATGLTLLSSTFEAHDTGTVGAGGTRRINYRIDGPLRGMVELRRARPWEPARGPTLSFGVDVANWTDRAERDGLYGPQRRRYLARVAGEA